MIQKVIFVFSSQTTNFCGVGDYTTVLASHINEAQEMRAEVTTVPEWSFRNFLGIVKKYRGAQHLCFHLQYPTYGMGWSLFPFLLPYLGKPTYVTLHEFELFGILRKIALLPMALGAKKIIFTNDYERDRFLRYFPFTRTRLVIIPIGNNIKITPSETPVVRRERLIYFGQIVKQKGLDFFVNTAIALRKEGVPLEIAIIGAVVDKELWRSLQEVSKRYMIDFLTDLPMEEVSRELQQSRYALLPFVDGISEKRGSALACFVHGLTVITRHTDKTPSWMKKASYDVATPAKAADLIIKLMNGKNAGLLSSAEALKQALAEREWPEIARQHVALYRQ